MEDTKQHVGKTEELTNKVFNTLCRKEFSFHRSTSSLKYHSNTKHKVVWDSASANANAAPRNRATFPDMSRYSTRPRHNAEPLAPPGDSEDYVADSEDEATKNFKVRLFVKRYYKTKHGTYVPTLREFWKPGMNRRNLLSPTGKYR